MQTNSVNQAGAHTFTLSISGNDTLSLRTGQVVRAEVVGTGPGGSAAIRVNNGTFTVETEVPLQQGEILSLQVEKQENVVYLRLAGNSVQNVDGIKTGLLSALKGFSDIRPGAAEMARLTELLRGIPEVLRNDLPEINLIEHFLLPVGKLSGARLHNVVQNGGVFFETKLRILALGLEADGAALLDVKHIIASDLKAALLRFKDTLLQEGFSQLLSAHALDRKELLEGVNSILRNIEFYQLQSKLSDTPQFFLPLVWKELKDGELIFRESDRGKPGENKFSCTVQLDLERIGKIRVDLLLQSGYVHVSCAAENEVFSHLLEESSGLLEKQFESSGLRLGSLTVHHQEKIDFAIPRAGGISIRA